VLDRYNLRTCACFELHMCRNKEKLNMLGKIHMYVGKPPISILDRILRRIAEELGTNAYRIARIPPRLDRVTVMRIISKYRLVEEGYVRVEKGKRNAKRYFITLKGILIVLYKELLPAEDRAYDHAFISKIIKTYSSLLPLVFGKWDYFDRIGVGKMALCRLKAIADNRDVLEPGSSWIPGKSMEEKISWYFYFVGFLSFPQSPTIFEGWCGMENPQKWMNALVQDEDVRAFVIKEIETYQRALKSFGAFVERHAAWIIGTKEKR
jgi:hypothetical protein